MWRFHPSGRCGALQSVEAVDMMASTEKAVDMMASTAGRDKVEGRMFLRYRDDEGSRRRASVFDLLPLPLRRDVQLAPKPIGRRRRATTTARARHRQWKLVERPAIVYLLWRDRGRAHIPLRHGSVYVIAPSCLGSPNPPTAVELWIKCGIPC